MSKRVKKRFTSEVKVIDFQPYLPQKKSRVVISARNPNQKLYLSKLHDEANSIVFAIGPAGTGKTMLAVQNGIKLFQEGLVDRIIVTRPAVSVDEDLGFLPGTLNEKMAPWTRPIFDVLGEYYQQKDIARMLEEGVIEISPLAYMRGRTFKNAYIIADEMQNATINQMKMLLTRLGENSKMVVTGDLAQADRVNDNGLIDFCNLLKGRNLRHIDIVQFDHKDIERHEAVREVLEVYGE
jgi:phosphate starvation-inducible PhoH-like protein